MPTIITSYFYENYPANDNALVMIPQWDGFKFLGYAVAKPVKARPDIIETWKI